MARKCKNELKKPKHGRAYYDPRELKAGTRVEFEHTKNPAIARNIAMNHLDEFPGYYTSLKTMEAKLKQKMRKTKRR